MRVIAGAVGVAQARSITRWGGSAQVEGLSGEGEEPQPVRAGPQEDAGGEHLVAPAGQGLGAVVVAAQGGEIVRAGLAVSRAGRISRAGSAARRTIRWAAGWIRSVGVGPGVEVIQVQVS